MLEIHYPPCANENASRWKGILEELVVGHKLLKDESLANPVLLFGTARVEGEQEIEYYLEELGGFVAKWRECRCDKYEFD